MLKVCTSSIMPCAHIHINRETEKQKIEHDECFPSRACRLKDVQEDVCSSGSSNWGCSCLGFLLLVTAAVVFIITCFAFETKQCYPLQCYLHAVWSARDVFWALATASVVHLWCLTTSCVQSSAITQQQCEWTDLYFRERITGHSVCWPAVCLLCVWDWKQTPEHGQQASVSHLSRAYWSLGTTPYPYTQL